MKLATREYGSGPRRIALVHGLSASGDLWGSLIERMLSAGGITVMTVDLRGHGKSDRAAGYTLGEFADDLVETLPPDLDAVIGHSLGGAVVQRAVARLSPQRAIYLDPGFAMALPTTGARGRLFWSVAPLALTLAAMSQRRKAKGRPAYAPHDAALRDVARAEFDRSMTVGVFRDIAFHPAPVEAPAVPSTIILSDDADSVLPPHLADALASEGWQVRRLAGIGHDFWLEDPDRTWDAIADLLAS